MSPLVIWSSDIWEETTTNFAWRHLCSYHLIIIQVNFTCAHVVEGVIKTWALWNTWLLLRGTHSTLEIVRLRVGICGKGRFWSGRVMSTVAALEQDAFWSKSYLLDLLVKQEVEISRKQALLGTRPATWTLSLIFVILLFARNFIVNIVDLDHGT